MNACASRDRHARPTSARVLLSQLPQADVTPRLLGRVQNRGRRRAQRIEAIGLRLRPRAPAATPAARIHVDPPRRGGRDVIAQVLRAAPGLSIGLKRRDRRALRRDPLAQFAAQALRRLVPALAERLPGNLGVLVRGERTQAEHDLAQTGLDRLAPSVLPAAPPPRPINAFELQADLTGRRVVAGARTIKPATPARGAVTKLGQPMLNDDGLPGHGKAFGGDCAELKQWAFLTAENEFCHMLTGERIGRAAFDLAKSPITPLIEITKKDGATEIKKLPASKTLID